MMNALLLATDQLLTGFIVGVTVWFFFIQSPFLFQLMGKEKFVPIMMQLTRLWVSTMFYSATALLVVSLLLLTKEVPLKVAIVAIGWLAITINKFVVVPKALKAGARSRNGRKGDNSKDVQEFIVDGGGKSETKALHQTVVVFVLIMSGAFVLHLVDLAAAASP
jgi:hypothetical protein